MDLETKKNNDDMLLRSILNGTASETGAHFFRALVKNLSQALGTYGAWVTEYLPEVRRLRAFAFWLDDQHNRHHKQCQIINLPF